MNGLSKEEIEEVRAKMPPSIAKTATDEEVTKFWRDNVFEMPVREDLIDDVISVLQTSKVIVEGKWYKENERLIVEVVFPEDVRDAQYEAERLAMLFGEYVKRWTPMTVKYNGGEFSNEEEVE